MQTFLSYSRVDKAFALRLTNDLQAAGFDIWLDIQSIPHGSNWDLEVQRGLEGSDTMLVLLSPTASASENVKDEWNYFIEKKRRIIPVMIQPNEVPFRLSRRQRIDFTNKPYDQALSELSDALNEKPETGNADQTISTAITRNLAISWGDSYSALNGVVPVSTGQAQFAPNTLRLIAPDRLPFVIPVTSVIDAKLRRLPWDSYLTLDFVDKSAHRHQIALIGTERRSRVAIGREFLQLLGAATGKRFGI